MAELIQQCSATVSNAVGRLAEVTDKVKEAGVNILAVCAWTDGDTGHLMLAADEPQKACEAISQVVDECGWDEVVRVKASNTPGALSEIARKLADEGIAINFIYATTTEAPEAGVILNTSDNAKAAEIL